MPGLRSFEISDDAIEALYKLKSNADPKNAAMNEQPDTMADQPSDKKSSSATPSTSEPKPNPNTQSHSLTFIPDEAEADIKIQKSGSPPSPESNDKNKDHNTPKKDTEEDKKQSSDETKAEESSLDQKIFTPTTKLKPWDKRSTLYGLGQNSDKIRSALIVFSSEPEYANPQTLMDVAALYAQVGDYKSAARYYYAAQLRRAFDIRRFPASNIPPLEGGTWGSSVGAWITASSSRMQNVINDVRAWDERIPYRYHPGYRIPERSINAPVPSESDWNDILNTTRTDFFKSVGDINQALGRMGK